MVNIERLVLYVIIIVVGLILLTQFLPDGQFEKAKGAFNQVKNYLPDVGIGAEVLHAEKLTIPQEHRQSLVSLRSAIEKALYSEKSNCFSSYQPFSELGEQGTTIDFEYDAATGTKVVIRRGRINQQQEITDETFNIIGMKPCVIAGATSIVENFDHAFLNRESGVPSSYFTEANFIRIAFAAPWLGSNKNKIAFGNSPEQLTTFYDFEGDGWLFTPSNIKGTKPVCFFPTESGMGGCEANSNALDTDCFTRPAALVGQAITDEQLVLREERRQEQRQPATIINIPALVSQGVLNQC